MKFTFDEKELINFIKMVNFCVLQQNGNRNLETDFINKTYIRKAISASIEELIYSKNN